MAKTELKLVLFSQNVNYTELWTDAQKTFSPTKTSGIITCFLK